jgi:hypothetical protein
VDGCSSALKGARTPEPSQAIRVWSSSRMARAGAVATGTAAPRPTAPAWRRSGPVPARPDLAFKADLEVLGLRVEADLGFLGNRCLRPRSRRITRPAGRTCRCRSRRPRARRRRSGPLVAGPGGAVGPRVIRVAMVVLDPGSRLGDEQVVGERADALVPSEAPPMMRSPRGRERPQRSSCPAIWMSRTRCASRRVRTQASSWLVCRTRCLRPTWPLGSLRPSPPWALTSKARSHLPARRPRRRDRARAGRTPRRPRHARRA